MSENPTVTIFTPGCASWKYFLKSQSKDFQEAVKILASQGVQFKIVYPYLPFAPKNNEIQA